MFRQIEREGLEGELGAGVLETWMVQTPDLRDYWDSECPLQAGQEQLCDPLKSPTKARYGSSSSSLELNQSTQKSTIA